MVNAIHQISMSDFRNNIDMIVLMLSLLKTNVIEILFCDGYKRKCLQQKTNKDNAANTQNIYNTLIHTYAYNRDKLYSKVLMHHFSSESLVSDIYGRLLSFLRDQEINTS